MSGKITVAGIGPGNENQMTAEVFRALEEADVIIGYTTYLELLPAHLRQKDCRSTPMTKEEERCSLSLAEAEQGKKVVLISSGDAGVYGMASLMLTIAETSCLGLDAVEILPGVTAAGSGAAVLGAPINHDFCCISLSDRLTPWDTIEKRLICAAEADLVIVLYNPASKGRQDHLRHACDILLTRVEEDRACGYVRNIGRQDTAVWTGSLCALREESVDMFTTVFIGNRQTRIVDQKLITPRGYRKEIS